MNEGPRKNGAKKGLPATPNERIMLLLSAVISEERSAFRRRFWRASKDDKGEKSKCSSSDLCNILISWITKAFQGEPFQLCYAGDMFPESWIELEHLTYF